MQFALGSVESAEVTMMTATTKFCIYTGAANINMISHKITILQKQKKMITLTLVNP